MEITLSDLWTSNLRRLASKSAGGEGKVVFRGLLAEVFQGLAELRERETSLGPLSTELVPLSFEVHLLQDLRPYLDCRPLTLIIFSYHSTWIFCPLFHTWLVLQKLTLDSFLIIFFLKFFLQHVVFVFLPASNWLMSSSVEEAVKPNIFGQRSCRQSRPITSLHSWRSKTWALIGRKIWAFGHQLLW